VVLGVTNAVPRPAAPTVAGAAAVARAAVPEPGAIATVAAAVPATAAAAAAADPRDCGPNGACTPRLPGDAIIVGQLNTELTLRPTSSGHHLAADRDDFCREVRAVHRREGVRMRLPRAGWG